MGEKPDLRTNPFLAYARRRLRGGRERESMSPTARSQVRGQRPLRYAVAVAAVFVLTLMRLVLTPVLGDHLRFIVLLPAVVLSAWYGGLGAGLAATGLSAGAAAYLHLTHAFEIKNLEDITAFFLFLIASGLISLLSENLIRTRRGLESSLEALQRRARHAALAADVGVALTGNDTVRDSLQCCAEAIVRHLDAAFARIWTLDDDTNVLELQASAGLYTHLDGAHSRVPLGKLKIGCIAAERVPYLTNAVVGDPQVSDQDWARREGMVAFAGYPLVVEDRLVGVMAMFARVPLRESTLAALGSVAHEIALGIQRRQGEAALRESEERFRLRTLELEMANKELEAFSYSVSHDLRNPLGIVDGYSHVLLTAYADNLDKTGRDCLQRVRAVTAQMAQLIDDLLQFSLARRAELRHDAVDLSTLAETVVAELRQMDPERQVTVAIAPGLAATGDRGLLRVVLRNLLGNAWKFTSTQPQPRIDLGAAHQGGTMVYFVRDNGVGFDMAKADKLFGAFQRLHNAQEFPGSGIGLATVQRIVQRHGGRVWAEATVGKGAVFYFTL